MAEYLVKSGDLTAVAEAIRQKDGTTEPLAFPEGFVTAVANIPTGQAEDAMAQFIQGTLTEVVNSDITTMGQTNLFYRCASLVNVELPNAEGNCPEYAFYFTTGLETCKLPKVTRLKNSCFMGSGLIEGDFSAVSVLESGAFRSCSRLQRLELPNLQSILSYNNFLNCTSLTTLVLSGQTMAALDSDSALDGTPIAAGTGYIYVPSALLSAYQQDSVWNTFAAQFRAIEDYPDVSFVRR